MREDDSNWFFRWEEELPSPEELMPLSQTLITPDLAIAFDIKNPTSNLPTTATPNSSLQQNQPPPPPPPPPTAVGTPSPNNPLVSSQPNSSEFAADSADLGSGARTLNRPRLVWTPQLHKRFVDAVAHLGIKNAVPKTIMQLMSVDGLTRENVASHLQKYRLYLKRMQGLSAGGGGAGNGGVGGGGLGSGTGAATDHLFASSPVPPHFLHPGRSNYDHFIPFVPVTLQLHQIPAAVGHPQLQNQYHRQMDHFGSSPNGQFEHPFIARQTQQLVHRMGAPVHTVTYLPVEGCFFDKVRVQFLEVLNLSNMKHDILPMSVVDLHNLRALFLRNCRRLRQVPSLAGLKMLVVLDLCYSENIKEVPEGLESISKLKYLNLYRTGLKEFPVELLENLTGIQFLASGAEIDSSFGVEVENLANLKLCVI